MGNRGQCQIENCGRLAREATETLAWVPKLKSGISIYLMFGRTSVIVVLCLGVFVLLHRPTLSRTSVN